MSGEDVKVLQAELKALSEITHRIEKAVEKNREETREDIKRLHQRLDEQINEQKAAITRTDCEAYRSRCTEVQGKRQEDQDRKFEAQDQKIKESKGSPPWVVVLFSVSASLIVFVATLGFFLLKIM